MTFLIVLGIAVVVLGLVFLILGPRREPEVGRDVGREDVTDE